MSKSPIDRFPCVPAKGYYVDYGTPDEHGFKHTFCGPNDTPGADCPNCKKPLYRMYHLDTADPRLEIGDAPFPFLPLLTCWRCNVAQENFFYAINDAGRVQILECGKGFQCDDFPYDSYPDFFPQAPLRLKDEVPLDRQTALAWTHLDAPAGELDWYGPLIDHACDEWGRHQVGGVPFICQFDAFRECPRCRERMELIATVADDNTDERGFTDNRGVQMIFHYCRICFIVCGYHLCD